ERFFFHIAGDAFCRALQDHSLLYDLNLPLNTKVSTVLSSITTQMVNSPLHYRFLSIPQGAVAPHNLTLLGLRNRGIPRKDGQIRLLPYRVTEELTLEDLACDRRNFVNEKTIDSSGRFIIHLAVARSPLSHLEDGHYHTCLTAKFNHLFPLDNEFGPDHPSSLWCECTGDEEDVDEQGNAPPPSVGHNAFSLACPSLGSNRNNRSIPLEASLATLGVNSLPTSIWDPDHPWVSPTPTYEGKYSMDNLPTLVYEEAAGAEPPLLTVTGETLDDAASKFGDLIDEAARNGDFTLLLSSSRHFNVWVETDTHASFGTGIENEVLSTLFQRFVTSRSQYFVERQNGFCTLKCMTSFGASPSRLAQMRRFGAVCALLYVRGQAPELLSPAVTLFIVYNFDFGCLTPAFVGEWFGELRKLLLDWKDLGPEGDPRTSIELQAHFAAYHDSQVSAYVNRDASTHESLAVDMLYRATLGADIFHHPEWKAFAEGFDLPCRNGFRFTEVLRCFEGGPEVFLSLCGMSQITGYQDLEACLSRELARLRAAVGDNSITYRSLVIDFLKGSGIPCPGLFDEIKSTFSRAVDLGRIDSPAFRSRMLVWAATGSQMLNMANQRPILLYAVEDTDIQYFMHTARAQMAQTGTICFRTCFQTVRFPASYLTWLAGNYHSLGEATTFFQAFEHWLLVQLLSAIGNPSII
ncbi:hypothetical protein FPV67DRAFT_1434783, partial [Lyophyllum atratum]